MKRGRSRKIGLGNRFLILLFALIILINFFLHEASAGTITINSTNSFFDNVFSINNGTANFYSLNISKGTTTNELISKIAVAGLETKNLNSSSTLNLTNQNITFETISLRQKKEINLNMSGNAGNIFAEASSSSENNFDLVAGKTFTSCLYLPNNGAVNVIMSKGGGLAGNGYILRIDNNRRISFKINGTTTTIGAANIVKNDVWECVYWTFNSTTAKAYINGTLIGSALNNETGGNNQQFTVGAQSNSKTTTPLNGSIRMVSVINQTLSDQQAETLYWNDGFPTQWTNRTEISRFGYIAVKPNGELILSNEGNVSISTDKGATVTLNHTFAATRNGSTSIFIDEDNNTYINWHNINALFRYQNFDFTSEQRVVNISCDNSTSSRVVMPDLFTQAQNGNLFIGTYDATSSGVNYDEQCGHIYMSTDKGATWSLIYNDTAEESLLYRVGRHTHSVQCDPYSSNCYASIGDGAIRNKFMRFNQDGTGFTILKRGYEDGISWQPTTIALTEDYLFVGEDLTPTDEYSRILRSNDNGTTWEVVFNDDKVFQGFIWGQVMINQTTLCMNYRSQDGTTDGIGVCSNDNFNTHFIYYRIDSGSVTNAVRFPSNAGPNGEFYVLAQGNSNFTRVEINPKPQVIALYPMHENSGNISHDISENGFHGDINGTLWNFTSSEYNYLNKYADFELNGTHGNITLLNPRFNWSEVEVDYDYFTGQSIYQNLKIYHNFDIDNSSTSFDLSKILNFSKYQGTAAPNATGGVLGTAGMTSNGNVANYLRVSASDILNFTNKNITITMWVKPNPGMAMGGLFSTTIGGTGPRVMFGTQTSESQLSLRIESHTGEAKVSFVSDTFLNQPEWRHIALKFEGNSTGTKIGTFVNGAIEDIAHYNVTGDIYNLTDASIGKIHSTSSINGSMDEFMLFDTALLDSQIKAIYDNQSERFFKEGRIQSNGNLSITTGNNRLNISINPVNVTSLVNISAVIHYFNTSWSDTPAQLITDNSTYNYSISSSSSAVRFNFSLAGENGFYSSFIGDNFSYHEEFFENSESAGGGGNGCSTDWSCSGWGTCANGVQARNCTKIRESCSVNKVKPNETQACTAASLSSGTKGREVCDNGICEEGENENSCPQDCATEKIGTREETAEKEEGGIFGILGTEKSLIAIVTITTIIAAIIVFLLFRRLRNKN